MYKLKNTFIKTVSKLGNLVPTPLLTAITNQKLIFPFYHIVSDDDVPHIKHLYSVKGVKSFIKDLDFLLKHYQPIDFFDLKNRVFKTHKLSKPAFLLTFDDGLKEFYENIAPILLQKGIPSVSFLNSYFIDNKALFYRYKASLLIHAFSEKKEYMKDDKIFKWFTSFFDKHQDIKRYLLSISYQNKDMLDDLAKLINLDFGEYLNKNQPYLTTSQILALQKQGFYFGSHSIDYPQYNTISFDEQIRQTKDSTENICNQFSLNYKTFAFPFSDAEVSERFFEKMYKELMVDISFGTGGLKKDAFNRNIQRMSMERNHISAKEIVNLELLKFIFRHFTANNSIERT